MNKISIEKRCQLNKYQIHSKYILKFVPTLVYLHISIHTNFYVVVAKRQREKANFMFCDEPQYQASAINTSFILGQAALL